MIGFFRLLGILNAAVWFGTVVFFTFGAGPAFSSKEMQALLDVRHFPYFSGAISQVVQERYYDWQLACALVAVCLAGGEWLYSGKVPDKLWRGLVVGLIAVNLFGALVLQPALTKSHQEAYRLSTTAERRKLAFRSFRAWQSVSDVFNLVLVGGLGANVWRMGNPPDPTRFVSTTKFRS